MALALVHDRPLAPLTTLGLGGTAHSFVEARTREDIFEVLALARAQALPVGVLGGGSNLVVPDDGFRGLVLQVATRGIARSVVGDYVLLTAQAGESWDELVGRAVDENLYGIECLTGIPGCVGATPIQNVGAYGQEVAQVIEAVEVLDRARGEVAWLSAAACGFGYRDSRFKRSPDAFVVLAVRFRLATRGAPALGYPELARAIAARAAMPALRDVQACVRELRSRKGMLIEPGWEPSAGSFFTNPIVTAAQARDVALRAQSSGAIAVAQDMPQFIQSDGRVKLSAGWLIERAGIARGTTSGGVGVSAKHALALVHRGGGSTRDLLALAESIQRRVTERFGVALEIEPVRW